MLALGMVARRGRRRRLRSLAIALGLASSIAASACGGAPSSDDDDDDDDGDAGSGGSITAGKPAGGSSSGKGGATGGSSASGAGGTTGGAGSSAGAATAGVGGSQAGGAAGSGPPGGGAGAGGAGGTAGGSSSAPEVGEVRCFDSTTTAFEYCFGKVGDLWVMVDPPCMVSLLDAEADYLPLTDGPSVNTCPGESDELSGWEGARCWRVEGFGFPICLLDAGDYWLEAFVACDGAPFDNGLTPAATNDPGTASCGAASGTSGWDEVRCYAESGATYCYGRLGKYWFGPAFQALWLSGLYDDCVFDDFTSDPDWVEIAPSTADCM